MTRRAVHAIVIEGVWANDRRGQCQIAGPDGDTVYVSDPTV